MSDDIDDSARIVDSDIGRSEVREFVTIHDSAIGHDCRIYERTSLKKCKLYDSIDINAGSYIENAIIEEEVQIGPNSSIAGVTHALDDKGMEFRNDIFEQIILREGTFVGAGAVLAPGIEIGARTVISAGAVLADDVESDKVVIGSPPDQQIKELSEWL